MTLLIRTCLAATLPLSALTVSADDVLPGFEVTPFVGYRGGGHFRDVDGDADIESAASFGVAINLRADYNTQWEVLLGSQSTDIDDSDTSDDRSKFPIDLHYLQVGGTYVFDGDTLRPFVSVTLGATRINPDIPGFEAETYVSGSFGLGLRYDLTRRIGLRAEARTFGLFGKSNSLVFCDTSLPNEQGCFLAGDGGVVPQVEGSVGVSFRF